MNYDKEKLNIAKDISVAEVIIPIAEKSLLLSKFLAISIPIAC